MEIHLHIDARIDLHEQALLLHFLIIFTAPVDLRPDGYHRLDPKLL